VKNSNAKIWHASEGVYEGQIVSIKVITEVTFGAFVSKFPVVAEVKICYFQQSEFSFEYKSRHRKRNFGETFFFAIGRERPLIELCVY